jgi:hypothetical protein
MQHQHCSTLHFSNADSSHRTTPPHLVGRIQRAVPKRKRKGHPICHQLLHFHWSRRTHRRPQGYVQPYVLCVDCLLVSTIDVLRSSSLRNFLCHIGISVHLLVANYFNDIRSEVTYSPFLFCPLPALSMPSPCFITS